MSRIEGRAPTFGSSGTTSSAVVGRAVEGSQMDYREASGVGDQASGLNRATGRGYMRSFGMIEGEAPCVIDPFASDSEGGREDSVIVRSDAPEACAGASGDKGESSPESRNVSAINTSFYSTLDISADSDNEDENVEVQMRPRKNTYFRENPSVQKETVDNF
ncbi:hypothetical protein ABEB36_015782 [Hypothenemus hampei]|uniref:Uncharacterized protein n=1 Tax=Hypothenemus hampei TaxID=57062 RepID=A0ABD1DYR2_HYPHA